MKFAFTNYGVSLGLQAVDEWPARVTRLNSFFETYSSGDEYDTDAITHVMGCVSLFPASSYHGALGLASNDSSGQRTVHNHSLLNSSAYF